ncbi:MAG: hypothetical protein PHW62_00035 [Candidatus Ratteibacteria bacterium]|nr:hypothetical protein [Candidatus Ratteibacteria bacterium]
MKSIGAIQIIKKEAREGNARVSIELGTLYIPLQQKDADSIELIEEVLHDPELESMTNGELVELLQEAIFQLQIELRLNKRIKPHDGIYFSDLIKRKAYQHIERLRKGRTDSEIIEIFQDAMVWFNIIAILKYTDEVQIKKKAEEKDDKTMPN